MWTSGTPRPEGSEVKERDPSVIRPQTPPGYDPQTQTPPGSENEGVGI